MTYKDSAGNILYPVSSFEKNQHKLYNAYDRARIRVDEERTDEAYECLERTEKALEAFNRYVFGNTVYATYEDGNLIRDFIGAYDLRGDLNGHWKDG